MKRVARRMLAMLISVIMCLSLVATAMATDPNGHDYGDNSHQTDTNNYNGGATKDNQVISTSQEGTRLTCTIYNDDGTTSQGTVDLASPTMINQVNSKVGTNGRSDTVNVGTNYYNNAQGQDASGGNVVATNDKAFTGDHQTLINMIHTDDPKVNYQLGLIAFNGDTEKAQAYADACADGRAEIIAEKTVPAVVDGVSGFYSRADMERALNNGSAQAVSILKDFMQANFGELRTNEDSQNSIIPGGTDGLVMAGDVKQEPPPKTPPPPPTYSYTSSSSTTSTYHDEVSESEVDSLTYVNHKGNILLDRRSDSAESLYNSPTTGPIPFEYRTDWEEFAFYHTVYANQVTAVKRVVQHYRTDVTVTDHYETVTWTDSDGEEHEHTEHWQTTSTTTVHIGTSVSYYTKNHKSNSESIYYTYTVPTPKYDHVKPLDLRMNDVMSDSECNRLGSNITKAGGKGILGTVKNNWDDYGLDPATGIPMSVPTLDTNDSKWFEMTLNNDQWGIPTKSDGHVDIRDHKPPYDDDTFVVTKANSANTLADVRAAGDLLTHLELSGVPTTNDEGYDVNGHDDASKHNHGNTNYRNDIYYGGAMYIAAGDQDDPLKVREMIEPGGASSLGTSDYITHVKTEHWRGGDNFQFKNIKATSPNHYTLGANRVHWWYARFNGGLYFDYGYHYKGQVTLGSPNITWDVVDEYFWLSERWLTFYQNIFYGEFESKTVGGDIESTNSGRYH